MAGAAYVLSPLAARIMDALADGRPMRHGHLEAQVAQGLSGQVVRRELEFLWAEGRIAKPCFGWWILGDALPPSPSYFPSFAATRKLGATFCKTLALLSVPTSAPALMKELRLTRQRVSQILQILFERNEIVRLPHPHLRRWLWLRADVVVTPEMREHWLTRLPPAQVTVLNALVPDAFHWVRDITAFIGGRSAFSDIRRLEAAGLVATMHWGQRRYVGITPSGLERRERVPSAPRAAITDLSTTFSTMRVAVLETLAVLGSAKSATIAGAIMGDDPVERKPFAGTMIALLRRCGWLEPAPGQQPNRHPEYRLTEAGRTAADLVARTRPPPSPEALLDRASRYKVRQNQRLRGAVMRHRGSQPHAAVLSPAQQAILEALRAGPTPIPALRVATRPYLSNRRSIHNTLRVLLDRGAVRRTVITGRRAYALPIAAPDAAADCPS